MYAYSVQSSNTNYARTTDRIWLDSNEMHQGEYSWKMMKVSDVKASAEEVSSLGYNTSDWLSAIVPGTVLNSLVYNKKYPEPYYGLNNKIESNKIPDISKVGREFYTYWFRTEFEVPASFSGKNIWLQPDGINYRAATIYFFLRKKPEPQIPYGTNKYKTHDLLLIYPVFYWTLFYCSVHNRVQDTSYYIQEN